MLRFKKTLLLSTALLVLLLFCANNKAHAIDTTDWELMGSLQLFSAKPDKEWLLQTAMVLLHKAIKPMPKDTLYFEKYLDKESNRLEYVLEKPWNDISSVLITYSKMNNGNYLYGICFSFKDKSLTILDVIGRYGLDAGEVIVNEDLSKKIEYTITPSTRLRDGHPLRPMRPLRQGHKGTILSFISDDKVHINRLMVAALIKEGSDDLPEIK